MEVSSDKWEVSAVKLEVSSDKCNLGHYHRIYERERLNNYTKLS